MPRRTDISSILIAGAGLAPSPRWGEGWGEGARTRRLSAGAEPPHPALSPRGRGLVGAVAGEEKLRSDRLEHPLRIGEHVVVPEAKDAVAVFLDDRGSGGVASGVVLPAVQLDRQPGRAAGEIRHIGVDLELADELFGYEPTAAKMMPEALFGVGLVAAEFARDRSQAFSSQLSSPSPNPLPAGESAQGCRICA